MSRFLERLDCEIVVGDGGMGSMLHGEVVPPKGCFEELCRSHPDLVLGVHLRYLQAGAMVIETNSFGANRHKLASFGLGDAVAALNGAAVKIAREAREIAGSNAFIAGSIGPSWMRYERTDAGSAAALRALFREQAEALEGRGVDLFMLETFGSLWELEQAIEAVRSVSSLPIVASPTFPADAWEGREPGPEPARFARRLLELGVEVIGTNCSIGPEDMLQVLDELCGTGAARLAVAPNTGVPRRVDGRFLYPAHSPEYFGWFASEAARRGARLIGGCCGSTPDHVRAIREAVAGLTPTQAIARVEEIGPPPALTSPEPTPHAGRLAAKLAAGQFVVSIQIDPPKGTNPTALLDAVKTFRDSGQVDTVDVNSNPLARLHMDSLSMSILCERNGVEAIPHITPRDSSLMGIEASLLGAWSLGIKNLLVITGDPSQSGDFAGKTDVYQTDSIGLVQEIRDLNRGRDCAGNRIGDPPGFLIGVAVNPTEPNLDHEVERFRRKIEVGAEFAMTQVFFDWKDWERFLARFGGPLPIPVLAAIWPMTSAKLALRIHREVPGIVIPPWLLERLERSEAQARAEGFAIARELLAEARRQVAGVYVIAPFKSPAAALELFE